MAALSMPFTMAPAVPAASAAPAAPAATAPAAAAPASVPDRSRDTASFLVRRPDGRLLGWRTGLPPTVHAMPPPTKESIVYGAVISPFSAPRGRARAARPTPYTTERVRHDMLDFVKATVWANHDTLCLRPAPAGRCCAGKALCRKASSPDTDVDILHILHIHDDGATHMRLGTADAATAREHGWAVDLDDTPGAVAVFAPRGAAEMGDWKRLVVASVRASLPSPQALRLPERL